MADPYQIDPLQYLGILNSNYRTELYKLATTNSSAYFSIKSAVEDSVKKQVIQQLHNHIVQLLTVGCEGNNTGKGPGRAVIVANGQQLKPQVPMQKVTEIALGVSETLDKMLQEIIDLILPLDFEKIILARYKTTGNINVI